MIPPHRDGGQAEYVTAPVAGEGEDQRLAFVLAWARGHLDHSLTVDTLAEL
ncbi:hypothetical protein FRACA_60059 [Frankia canadensis]|uniref:Uncharacterized protein n=1 Tax=Frankia canadensis TaxID=1836972 RepID=A0A2I2KZI3_9ACTN|nr:hypothetical protein [Frankia canadensis]SNQ51073.1 hypothetical protein FRACA_60059 [Frankia canadensis]SOU58363.1 hypothetical protein FRACA_60059 [Frankia canadensis]